MVTRYHMCLECSGGIKNAKNLIGCITVDGKTLNTEKGHPTEDGSAGLNRR